ncbi:MAG: glycosyl hydrolase family 28-related protein, partial [Verrucomicrobiota bacterium]
VKTDITPVAVGDGVADDTAALQAAFAKLDDTKAGAPRIFYFPPGTYRITDTLTLTKVQGGAIYGHGGATRIVWGGRAGGRMFHSNGFGRSMWFGLSLDGAGKAAVGVDHDSKTYYETRVRYQYCRFANFTESGIRVGHDQKMASAEMMFYDLIFTNCERGISFLEFNDYDNAIIRNIFRNCGSAIHCYRGNVYVRDSHFENSREQDLLLPPHTHSIRRCTSVGSSAFIRPSQAGEFPFLLEVQDCHVSGWKDAKGAVQLSNRGPSTFFDSIFTAPSAADSPAITLGNPANFQQTLITANLRDVGSTPAKITRGANARVIEVPREREMLIAKLADRRWDHRPELPTKVFDARTDFKAAGDGRGDDASAIQAAIAAAQAYGKGAEAYLPVGNYRLVTTLDLPAGNYSFGGSLGWCAILKWAGPSNRTMLRANNADGVTVRQLRFSGPPGLDLASLRVTADRPGHFRCDGVYAGGSRNPRFRGLVLDSLPAGFTVSALHVNGDTLVQNCGDARILIDNWYADYNGPFTIAGGGGRGFTGINSGVASCCDVDLTVRDNASIVFGDFYSEQTRAHLLATGKPGQKPGRITISAAKQEGHAVDKIKIDGYAGQVTYSRANFANSPHAFTGRSDGHCRLLLMANVFNPQAPTFDLNGVASISVGNLVWNFQDKSKQLPIPNSSQRDDAFSAVNVALDHLRELSQANLEAIPAGQVVTAPALDEPVCLTASLQAN